MKTILLNCVIACAFPLSGLFAQDATQNLPVNFEQMALDHGLDSIDVPGFVHYQMYGTHMHDTTSAMRYQPVNGAPLFVGNPGFESGDFTSWTGYIGDNTVNSNGPLQNIQPGIYTGAVNPAVTDMNARHSIMTTAGGNDPEGGFPVCPAGSGIYTARLGNNYAQYQGQILEQRWTVTPHDSLFCVAYAVVIYDGAHPAGEGCYFEYEITDTLGTPVFAKHDESSAVPANYAPGVTAGVSYLPWTRDTFDLASYAGTDLILRFATGGCIWGGHYAYCYVDADPDGLSTIGINEHSVPAVSVFPNPSATGIFNVVTTPGSSGEAPLVYDLSGREVPANVISTPNGWTIDISGLPAGVYTMSLITENGVNHCNLIR